MRKEKTESKTIKTTAKPTGKVKAKQLSPRQLSNGQAKPKKPAKLKISKLSPFKNEPPTDFSKTKNCEAFEAAIADVRQQMGKEYPAVIGGHRVKQMQEKLISTNPCNHSEVIGVFPKASAEHIEQAVAAATEAFASWKEVKPKERAACLLRAAKLLRQRKHEFSATMVLEAAKN
ncbi:MAG: aldehyde dehydrogenase family protein, partial [Chlorobiales bacterium]|nr:aldehyde dehydrogenase family protein [Chlorobiales bacterium]